MKDYAKLANTPREERASEREKVETKPNLIKTAKQLQPKEEQSSRNTFGILLVLFIVIVVGYGIIHQYINSHNRLSLTKKMLNNEIVAAKNAINNNQQNSEPQFDFYTVLPKGNEPSSTANTQNNSQSSTTNTSPAPAATPAPKAAAPVTTINTNTSNSTASNSKYYLNVGNYASNQDAQQILSQLLLLGVQASINNTQQNGTNMYAVMVGPFTDTGSMDIVKSQLSAHQFNSTVVQTN